MAELRQRKTNGYAEPTTKQSTTSSSPGEAKTGLKVTDVLRILGGILLLNSAISYFVTNESITWGYRPWWSKPAELRAFVNGPVRLTDDQLALYDGTDESKPIYLALNGTIYDVSAGRHAYGPDGSYSFFAGRDAARAFVTGCFDEDLTPDLRGVELTYMPRDPDEDPMVPGEEVGPDGELRRVGGVKGAVKAEEKTRRERELRLAKKKVQDTIEGWASMFRGDGGKPYFKVGEVVRDKDWLEKTPKRELCERAKKLRPKRKPGA